jgi:cytochrome c-type biogenesis protein CcmH
MKSYLLPSPLRITFLMVFLLSCLLLGPATARAQTPQDGPSINQVARDLYCPLCTGMTVDVCDLQVCDDMREIIAEQLEAGESPEQIKAYFVEQYGQKVLGKPATDGFHLLAWVLPFIGLLGAAVATTAWMKGRSREVGDAVPPASLETLSGEHAARLERELQRLEEQ